MYSFPPIAAAIEALYTVVTSLTSLLTPALGATSAAIAIVLLTFMVRVFLLPLGYAQARGEHSRARLAPKLRELQRRHRHNPERLNREMNALYAEQGASPLAGCLPTLAQAPIFSVLYGLFLVREVGGHANALLTHVLAGVPLGAHLASTGGPGLLVYVGLFSLLAVVAWLGRRLSPPFDSDAPGATVVRFLPYGTIVVAAFVPLATGLYLLASTAWTAAERAVFRRLIDRRERSGRPPR
jgi:YidC/Oxa1 family membrane protein insertase